MKLLTRLIFNIFLLSFFFTGTTKAVAGLLIEPYLGYSAGIQTYTVSGFTGAFSALNGDYKYGLSGPLFGARLGYKVALVSFGLDYSMGSFDTKVSTIPPGLTDNDLDTYQRSQVGAYVGAHFPFLKAWLTYLANVTLEDTNGSDKGDKHKASGIGLGVGLTSLPFISINLEYRTYTIDETESADGTTQSYPLTTAGTTVSEIKNKEYLLSVSLPFEL